MAVYKTITLTQDAYERLKSRKTHGDSFSDVVLRDLRPETPGVPAAAFLRMIEAGTYPVGPVADEDVAWLDTYDLPAEIELL